MSSYQKIMVVIDANEDFSASPDGLPIELRKALRFVKDKSSTELKLISVGYEKYLHHSFHSIGYDYQVMRKEYLTRLSDTMNSLVEKLGAEGYKISQQVAWWYPRYERIVEMATEFGADLLVQHCRAHAKIEHFHLTHDSWELVKHCSIPLLLVKDLDWGDKVTFAAAVDPLHSHSKPLQLDDLILDTVEFAATATAGDFHVLHAYAEAARPFASAGQIKEEHSKAFNDLVAKRNIPDSNLHLIDETPIYALDQYSDKLGVDVIVMGVISRSRLSDALIGSTAEKVLDYIKRDILVIKPKSS
ncbi:MAG: universal stress protein [Pseudomonadales bacterium]